MLTLVAGVEPKKSHLNLNPRRGNDPQSPHAGWLLAVLLTHVAKFTSRRIPYTRRSRIHFVPVNSVPGPLQTVDLFILDITSTVAQRPTALGTMLSHPS